MARFLATLVAGCGVGWACAGTGAFACTSDDQCIDGPHIGRCEPTGWCSFPSAQCPSGHQYAPHVGDGLGGECVDEAVGTTGGGSTSGGAETSGDDDGETSLTPTTGEPDPGTTTSEEGSSTEGGTVDTGEESTSTGEPVDPNVFEDDFDRPDGAGLGNGWIEKTPTAFQLVDGEVVFESLAEGYEDNLFYRDESVLDTEVCIDFRLLALDVDNHPQVHARIQPEDIDVPTSVTSYILYIDTGTLRLRRDIAGSSSQQWGEMLTVPEQIDAWYRLCMLVTGTDPVQLEGHLWVWLGGEWQLHTSVAASDESATRLTTPGATGSSGADADQIDNLVYDNFRRTLL